MERGDGRVGEGAVHGGSSRICPARRERGFGCKLGVLPRRAVGNAKPRMKAFCTRSLMTRSNLLLGRLTRILEAYANTGDSSWLSRWLEGQVVPPLHLEIALTEQTVVDKSRSVGIVRDRRLLDAGILRSQLSRLAQLGVKDVLYTVQETPLCITS